MICKHCGFAFENNTDTCPYCHTPLRTEGEKEHPVDLISGNPLVQPAVMDKREKQQSETDLLSFSDRELQSPIGSEFLKRGQQPESDKPVKPTKSPVVTAVIITLSVVAVVVAAVLFIRFKNSIPSSSDKKITSSALLSSAEVSSMPPVSSAVSSNETSSDVSSGESSLPTDVNKITNDNVGEKVQDAIRSLARLRKGDYGLRYQTGDGYTAPDNKVYYAVTEYASVSEVKYAYSEFISYEYLNTLNLSNLYESADTLYVYPDAESNQYLDLNSVRLEGGFDSLYQYYISVDVYDDHENYIGTQTVTVELDDYKYVIAAVVPKSGAKLSAAHHDLV